MYFKATSLMHIFLVSVFRLSRVSSCSFSSLKQLPSGVHYIKYSKQKQKHFQELLQYSVFTCADPLSGTEDYHCSRVLVCFKRQNMEHEQLSKHLLSHELNTYNKTSLKTPQNSSSSNRLFGRGKQEAEGNIHDSLFAESIR